VVCRFGLALGQQQESADLAARRRAAAHLGLGGLLATRVALAHELNAFFKHYNSDFHKNLGSTI
jgi:hypothetical protein